MTLLQVAGVALLIGVSTAFLRESGGKYTVFAATGGGALLLLWGISHIGGAVGEFMTLAGETALSPYLGLLVKAMGVGYVVSVASDICRDLGATETANRLELCGRAELLVLAIPPLTELLKLAKQLAEGA